MAYLYLRAAHSTTGLSLAHLFTGQKIWLHFDLLYPSLSEKMNKRYMNFIISEYKVLSCFCYHACIYLANLDNHFCFLIFPHIIRQLFSSLHLFAWEPQLWQSWIYDLKNTTKSETQIMHGVSLYNWRIFMAYPQYKVAKVRSIKLFYYQLFAEDLRSPLEFEPYCTKTYWRFSLGNIFICFNSLVGNNITELAVWQ